MPPETWVPDPEEVQRRKDFRESHLIMSIDPKGCEDVDDALCIRKLKNGRIELGGELFFFTLCSLLSSTSIDLKSCDWFDCNQRYFKTVLRKNICSSLILHPILQGETHQSIQVLYRFQR